MLAPLLFLCYINDISHDIRSTVKLYADDILIYRPIFTIDDCETLQSDLDRLQSWANKWKMCFNPKKCEFIRICNIKHPIISQYTIQNTDIQCVPHVTYLGVTIDQHLTWNQHTTNISNKANSIRGFLQRNISSCPITVKEACYKTMVRPILEYASPVWSPFTELNILKLEMVQRRVVRFIMNDFFRYSSVTSMIEQLGLPMLKQRRNEAKMIMMYKILNNSVLIDHNLEYNINYTRGHPFKLVTFPTRINAYHNSFFPSTVTL